jgi:glycosyltransferase involved in cell wall biosynthesis
MKKIVYVNNVVYAYATGDPSANGGAERYGWHMMRALANAGWSVTVGVRHPLQEGEEKLIDGVRFVGINRRVHFLFAWFRFLRKERPDWCYWQCADHLWGPIAEIARWLGVRTAFSTMHDLDVQPRKAMTHARKNLWFLYKWGLQRSNLIFVQHYGQRDLLPVRWRPKTYMLPGIVPLPATVVPHPERNGSVVWMAVIRPAKRPDLLVAIARRLPTIRFVVCGAPNYRLWEPEKIQSILAGLKSLPNVDYRGHVDPKETMKLIADGSLLLLTSEGEGYPSVFLEAWAAGTPVVSIKIDPDHKIHKGEFGIVADTVEGAIEAVRYLMKSPQLRHDMGMRARRHVEETHSSGAAVRAFECAVESIQSW